MSEWTEVLIKMEKEDYEYWKNAENCYELCVIGPALREYERLHPPVDELREKLKEFVNGSHGTNYMLTDNGFLFFKQIFADNLNPNHTITKENKCQKQ